MGEIELKMMQGMVSILNEAREKYHKGEPIMSDEMYDSRLKDLKQFEEEMGFMFTNSPTQKLNLKSITESNVCHDTNDIVNFFNQKDEVMTYIYLDGEDMTVTYEDGVILWIQIEDDKNLKQVINLPYKINKKGVYTICGKVALVNNKFKFFVDSCEGDDLKEAESLGFETIPNWVAAGVNPKTIQSTIDYIFDYAKEEEMSCAGISFRNLKTFDEIIYATEGSN